MAGSNPLPQIHQNSILEQRSIKALNALFKDYPNFLIRDERNNDYGIDASLELIIEGCATNFRSKIQLKATENMLPNANGSRSLSIPVSNLNYLLNGTSPLYLLYVASEDRFYFTWAVDEHKRLHKENPEWKSQETVTIHFSTIMEPNQFNNIHDRILREARLNREVRERIANEANCETIHFAINTSTMQTRDPKQAYELIVNSGLTAVSNGFVHDVLEIIKMLDFDHQMHPRVQLVCGYAWFCLGRYQQALASIGEALTKKEELNSTDMEVLLQIRDASECQIGKISRDEFVVRLHEQSDAATGAARNQDQIRRLRFEYLGNNDMKQKRLLLTQLRSAVAAACNDNYSNTYKLQARLDLAYCEGSDRTLAVNYAISRIIVSRHLSNMMSGAIFEPLKAAIADYLQWEQDMMSLIKKAYQLGVPLLIAETHRIRLIIRTIFISSQRFASFHGVGTKPNYQTPVLAEARADADQAATIYHRIGHIEGELRIKIELASLLEIVDDLKSARQLASEVLPIAKAMTLAELTAEAESYITGKTLLQRKEEESIARHKDEDGDLVNLDDDDIERLTRNVLETTQLPEDRFVRVKENINAMRLVARLRKSWCGNLNLIQDLLHASHPSTAYSLPIMYFGKCAKHKYESLVGYTDAGTVLERFKTAYCTDCSDRCPRQ
jgi:Domain of unknown function (DUF4365)